VCQQVDVTDQVQPAYARDYRENGEEPAEQAGGRTERAMNRIALLAVLAVAWVGLGVYGTLSYGEAYNTYRGFSPPVDPAGVTPGYLFHEKFYSAALGQQRKFLVYAPPGYARAAARGVRFPVLYLLHGSPGRPKQFINVAAAGVALDTAIQRQAVKPFLLVMPDGGDGTFRNETEWADTPHGAYESLVLEIVHTVDRRFHTVRNRNGRALGGNSEGGFGALNIALRNPRVFSIAESWSGYGLETKKRAFQHATYAQIYANSPMLYAPSRAAQLRRFPLHLYLYWGRNDKGLRRGRQLARVLARAGVHVTFRAFPGRHDWGVWRRETPRMLRYAGHLFASRHAHPSRLQLRHRPKHTPARRRQVRR
jgi:enterochelin esterase-like enzyme